MALFCSIFFFKQKTAYEMRISDWSSDVCSSDLIQIDNLAVSGEHAVIVTILNDSFLEDLGSTNGTVVNGNPVKKHFLQNNDVVELGKYKLKFVGEAEIGRASCRERVCQYV